MTIGTLSLTGQLFPSLGLLMKGFFIYFASEHCQESGEKGGQRLASGNQRDPQ